MKCDLARQLTRELLDHHGLTDWTVKINPLFKQFLGRCDWDKKIIQLAGYHVVNGTDKQIRNTILHEIAHALVGGEHGHDQVWKDKALEIGAQPKMCAPKSCKMPSKRTLPRLYRRKCGKCSAEYTADRWDKRHVQIYWCPDCCRQDREESFMEEAQ